MALSEDQMSGRSSEPGLASLSVRELSMHISMWYRLFDLLI
jgi:hypothetical protein